MTMNFYKNMILIYINFKIILCQNVFVIEAN